MDANRPEIHKTMCGSGFAVLVCGKFLMIELYRVLGDRWPANYFLVLYDIILGDRWPVKLVMDPSRLNSLPSLFFLTAFPVFGHIHNLVDAKHHG